MKKMAMHLWKMVFPFHNRENSTKSSKIEDPQVKEQIDDIIKGIHDPWDYRGIILQNEMKILLISDPTTDKSAAALDVHTGSLMDPDDFQGLAHICEHMLFMGTDQYQKYLSQHGGSSNAFTGADHTNFFFDVSSNDFSSALHIFASLVNDSVFTEIDLSSEIIAVDQEFRKNKINDNWRLSQLEKLLATPQSGFNKFSTGNKYTLYIDKQPGSSLFKAIKKFYNKWYSSNLMSITVLGKESLDELQNMVVELFSKMKNKNTEIMHWLNHPINSKTPKITYVNPLKDIHILILTFSIIDLSQYYKSGPCFYLVYIITYKGFGSLIMYLKTLGWINNLSAGHRSGARGFAFFVITLDLTLQGLNHINDIVKCVFQYLNMIKESGVNIWMFEECREIASIKFNVKDLEHAHNCVSNLAECLHMYPIKDVSSAGYLFDEFNPNIIHLLLDQLVPERVNLTVVSKTMEDKTVNIEKWYGTSYLIEEVKLHTVEEWGCCGLNDKLLIPTKNLFIPQDFNLKERILKDISEYPKIIADNGITKSWFKQDTYYDLPKAVIQIQFLSMYAQLDARNSALINLFVWIIRSLMKDRLHAAEMIDYNHYITASKNGFIVSLKGFNDKLDVVLEEVMNQITCLSIKPIIFDNLKDSFLRYLRNFDMEPPYKQAIFYTSLIISHKTWSKNELWDSVQDVSFVDFYSFYTCLLSSLHQESFFHGNLTEIEAKHMSNIISRSLKVGLSGVLDQPNYQIELSLPPGRCSVFEINALNSHESSCVQIYYQTGPMELENNVLLQLLCQIISEPAFNQLRTKEQLCYIIQCEVRRNNSMQGLKLVVQGNNNPSYLHERMDSFFNDIEKYLQLMTEHDFDLHKLALIGRRLEKPKKLSVLSSKWWFEITTRQYQFDRDTIESNKLQNISKQLILHFYQKYFKLESEFCRKLCIYIRSEAFYKTNKSSRSSLNKVDYIYNIDNFKSLCLTNVK